MGLLGLNLILHWVQFKLSPYSNQTNIHTRKFQNKKSNDNFQLKYPQMAQFKQTKRITCMSKIHPSTSCEGCIFIYLFIKYIITFFFPWFTMSYLFKITLFFFKRLKSATSMIITEWLNWIKLKFKWQNWLNQKLNDLIIF